MLRLTVLTDSSIQRVDWTYSVLAESIEYLSEEMFLKKIIMFI